MEQVIVSAWQAARRLEQDVLQRHGLTLPQFVALLELQNAGGRIATCAWAKRIMYAASTTTTMIDTLERNGWVTRVRSMADRRMIEIELKAPERLAMAQAAVSRAAAGIASELAESVLKASGQSAGLTA